jgi:hypothetical protein
MRIPSSVGGRLQRHGWLYPAQSIARSALWLFVVAWPSRQVRRRWFAPAVAVTVARQLLRDGIMDYDIFASTVNEWR